MDTPWMNTPWMNTEEAGQYARCSTKVILNNLEDGSLTGSRQGRRWVIHRDDIDAWLKGSRVDLRVIHGRASA